MQKIKNKILLIGLILSLVIYTGACGQIQPETDTQSQTDIVSQTSETDDSDKTYDSEDCVDETSDDDVSGTISENTGSDLDTDSIPAYTSSPYTVINNNIPSFNETDKTRTDAFETYSELDSLGRCGVAYANICTEIMPTEERGEIGMIKPSGWHTVKYDCVDGKYLYNRCHLIGYQLAGENANEKNLITGTRYLNVEGMLPFENMVADYVEETDNHVLYRVTPVFEGDNLLASGVEIEAYSVEDKGDGICFNVYCYNVQPGVGIDYADGESWLEEENSDEDIISSGTATGDTVTYVLNTNTMKFHYPTCSSVSTIKQKNYAESSETRDQLISQGYSPCGRCNP